MRAHAGGSRGGLSFNGSLVPKVPTGGGVGGQYQTPLTTTFLTMVFELALPVSGWWMFPHTGGDGFPSLALHIPLGGFQCVKLKLEFLKPRHFDLAWLHPGGTLPSSGCCRDPPDSCPLIAAFVKASRYLEPDKYRNQVFHLVWVCWLTYQHFQSKAARGELCLGLLGNAVRT